MRSVPHLQELAFKLAMARSTWVRGRGPRPSRIQRSGLWRAKPACETALKDRALSSVGMRFPAVLSHLLIDDLGALNPFGLP